MARADLRRRSLHPQGAIARSTANDVISRDAFDRGDAGLTHHLLEFRAVRQHETDAFHGDVVDLPTLGGLVHRVVDGHWRLAAATRPPLVVQYAQFQSGRPTTVHVRMTSDGGDPAADLKLELSDVEINTPIDAAAFQVKVPPDAAPLTLEELRRAMRESGDRR